MSLILLLVPSAPFLFSLPSPAQLAPYSLPFASSLHSIRQLYLYYVCVVRLLCKLCIVKALVYLLVVNGKPQC